MKLNFFVFCGLLALLNIGIYAQNAKSVTEPLITGAIAPDFTLSDQNGKQITLSKVKKPIVLIFYRGYW